MTRPRILALLLVLMTVAVYLPVWQCVFLTYDDPTYVTDNPMVRAGLTGAGLKWAFTTTHASNWHPLTWLSHMTDCELFGLRPGAHHLVNVLFHAVNAALLFLLLLRVTAAMWPAAFAETGQFAEAIKVAEQPIQLATAQTNAVLADAVRLRLEGYRAGKPFHEGVSAGR
jgi:hypothetical protein